MKPIKDVQRISEALESIDFGANSDNIRGEFVTLYAHFAIVVKYSKERLGKRTIKYQIPDKYPEDGSLAHWMAEIGKHTVTIACNKKLGVSPDDILAAIDRTFRDTQSNNMLKRKIKEDLTEAGITYSMDEFKDHFDWLTDELAYDMIPKIKKINRDLTVEQLRQKKNLPIRQKCYDYVYEHVGIYLDSLRGVEYPKD